MEKTLNSDSALQDSILVHLKASQGPISVLTCDLGSGDVTETNGCFATLEGSRIRTKMQQKGLGQFLYLFVFATASYSCC